MTSKTQGILILTIFMVIMPLWAHAEDLIKKGEILHLGKCIEIALKMHPAILAAQNTVRANQSRVGEAKANYYPQVSWTTSYSRNEPATATSSTPSTAGQSLGGAFNNYSSAVMLSQNIYDFGKTTAQVKIQTLNTDSSMQDLASVTSQVVFGVKQAYYGLLQAMKNRDVAGETVGQFQQHLDQAKGRFAVGVAPKFDVTKAEVDLSNATLNLLTAENNVRIARITLTNALGIFNAPEYSVEDNLTYEKYEITFEEALQKAYRDRPDLLSALVKEKSLGKTIDLAKTGYYPTLSGDVNYGYEGRIFPLDENWIIGTTLSFPIFSGFLTRYQVEEARANLAVQKANEDSLRQSIHLDVGQAYLNLQAARDKIDTAALTVKQATENSDIANGRYKAGVGNPVEVTDSLVALTNAKTSYIGALYDYKVAQASLEKAMGVKQ